MGSSFLPSQPLRHEAHTEGGQHAPYGEYGHRQWPQGREGPCGDGLTVPVDPCGIVFLLDQLGNNQEKKNFFNVFILSAKSWTCMHNRVTKYINILGVLWFIGHL